MAKILSNPATVIITAASGDSVIAKTARAMAPGTWAPVLGIQNQDAALGVGTVSGTMLHYCNSMPWNPVRKAIELIGMDHNAGAQRYVRFDAGSNSFLVVRADDGVGAATRHGYDLPSSPRPARPSR